MGKVELKIEVDEALLRRAEANGVSIDAAVDAVLRAGAGETTLNFVESARRQAADPVGAAERARKWAAENADGIRAYNARIARRGLFGTDMRRW
jgi:antitoxin CcdA